MPTTIDINELSIVIGIVVMVVVGFLVLGGCCKVSGREDDQAERIWKQIEREQRRYSKRPE